MRLFFLQSSSPPQVPLLSEHAVRGLLLSPNGFQVDQLFKCDVFVFQQQEQ